MSMKVDHRMSIQIKNSILSDSFHVYGEKAQALDIIFPYIYKYMMLVLGT